MTPQEMAEAFERARYEQLRGQRWSDLREAERATRAGVALRALGDSGIATVTERWRTTAARADELSSVVMQRDAEIARRRTEHDDEIRTLTAASEALAAGLTEQLAAVRAALDDALDRTRGAERSAAAAAAVIAAVRDALAGAPDDLPPTAGDAGAESTAAEDSPQPAPIAPGPLTQPEQRPSGASAQTVQRPAQRAGNRFTKARPVAAGTDRH